MINLLPHAQKKELERAYILRVVTLYILVAGCIALCGLVLLFPLYIVSVSKRQVVESQVASLSSQKNTTKEELNSIISDINAKLAIFSDPTQQFYFSKDIVVPVLAKQNSGVSITTISYANDPAASATAASSAPIRSVIVSGVAKDRESLLQFENNLKQNTAFTGVDVPISNFVSGSNINFNIQFQVTASQ